MEEFYTTKQKEEIKKISQDSSAKHRPLSEAMGAAILDALGEQQNTMMAILEEIKAMSDTGVSTHGTESGRTKIDKFVQALSDAALKEIEEALKSI